MLLVVGRVVNSEYNLKGTVVFSELELLSSYPPLFQGAGYNNLILLNLVLTVRFVILSFSYVYIVLTSIM